METYKNILLRTDQPEVIARCKKVIDYLQKDNYNTYEIALEMCDINGVLHYNTCLAEDNDRWISITGEVPVWIDGNLDEDMYETLLVWYSAGQVEDVVKIISQLSPAERDEAHTHFSALLWYDACDNDEQPEYEEFLNLFK